MYTEQEDRGRDGSIYLGASCYWPPCPTLKVFRFLFYSFFLSFLRQHDVHIFFCEMWVQLCFVHRGAGRDMTDYWGSTVESVVPDFKPKAWWDFLLETPGREMTITGESDFSPGLSSSTTLVQPTSRVMFPMAPYGDGSYSYCLLLTLVSGLQQRIRFPSLFKFGPLWRVGVPKCESCERGDHAGDCGTLMHLDSPQPPRMQTTSSENWSCPKPILSFYWLNPQQGDHI